MATFNKFQAFVQEESRGLVNLATDQITVVLCAAAHAPVATNALLADLTQISYTHCSSRNVTTTSDNETAGTLNFILADLTLTASGGAIAPFRYVIFCDSTAVGSPLICWYDYGSDLTLNDGESLLIDLDNVNGLFTQV